ncbi:FitA-like ribbon-helix-helix domain-containing protein [Terracidiphilus sp.]|jgi:antitoxin FitA|uniref:FitA-like ribbon-helix-helix domain-containing protein n=1 Tax=Terracidiphilus sp. TaxID=1964191 RepID=UPI003C1DDAE0
MATITIRNLDETVKRKLQVRAALHGRSMEAEARDVLTTLVNDQPSPRQENLAIAIRRRFARFGDVELQIPPRKSSSRPIPSFD